MSGERSALASYLRRKAVRAAVKRIGAAKLALVGILVALVGLFGLGLLAALVGGATTAPAQASVSCVLSGGKSSPPEELVPIYQAASARYELGMRGPSILAAINKVETGFGANLGPSSAGAEGWMQFMPETWEAYGVDADRDGVRDPNDPEDAIFAAANYLSASGAPGDWYGAIFAYNHADWYVQEVESIAARFGGKMVCSSAAQQPLGNAMLRSVQTLRQPRAWKAIPARFWTGDGPPQSVDSRIWANVVWVLQTFNLTVANARESGHETHGDGTAIDAVPRGGLGWDATARRAAEALGWRSSCGYSGTAPVCPLIPAIQFIGYNGYPAHGDPLQGVEFPHIHISWQSSSFGSGVLNPPPEWVKVFPLSP